MENSRAMITRTLIFATSITFFGATVPIHVAAPTSNHATVVGGPPAIRIAGKNSGDITAVEWNTVRQVDLVGCVPGVRIVNLHLCIKDCQGKNAGYNTKSPTLTDGMRNMVKNLPPDTPFTITVTVNDGDGKAWQVPAAKYTWKG